MTMIIILDIDDDDDYFDIDDDDDYFDIDDDDDFIFFWPEERHLCESGHWSGHNFLDSCLCLIFVYLEQTKHSFLRKLNTWGSVYRHVDHLAFRLFQSRL